MKNQKNIIGGVKVSFENKITNTDELPLSLTVSDISRILGIGKNNAYDLCHSESFPSIQIGKRLVIPKPAFIEWLRKPKNFNKKEHDLWQNVVMAKDLFILEKTEDSWVV